LTAAEYWKQRVATLADMSITAMTLAPAERPSIMRGSGNDLGRARILQQHSHEYTQVRGCSHGIESISAHFQLDKAS